MLSWPYRLYFWGVHGVFAEIVFTGIWEFVETGKWTLMGVTSIWSFLIYGFGTFGAEYAHSFLCSRGIPLLVRCLFYVVLVYMWEFTCGCILDPLGARSWDYSHFNYNIWGYITMEYAPVWYFAALYYESLLGVMKKFEPIPKWKQEVNTTAKQK